ncbi:MAG: dihydroorotase family protein [Candidatus Bathyarchaeia archaeon]
MPVDLVLKNAKIYFRDEIVEAGLAIEGDKIIKIAKETNLPSAAKEINLRGLLVLPGLIDAHVHFRNQELTYKEDFFSGSSAAANGGVTLVFDMPNNKPVTMSVDSLKERMNSAAKKSIVNIAFYSAFPEKIEDIPNIVREGAKAFKFFMSQKIGGINPKDKDSIMKSFMEVAELNFLVSIHAEDEDFLEKMLIKMKQENRNDPDAYLKVHSPEAEAEAIKRATEIAEATKAHTHICHVSTNKSINIISSAKRKGLRLSCEVTPHHLLLSSRRIKKLGAVALTNPPLRSARDIRSLWSALQTGLIDILVSDHAPHAVEDKKKSSVWDTPPGIPGIETLLPLMLTKVNEGSLSISTLVRLASKRPAEIFKIEDRGYLDEGCYADIVVVDMKKEWRIDSSKFYSKAKYSPFDGWRVKGKPMKTFVNGRLIMDDGEIVAKPGDGRIIM